MLLRRVLPGFQELRPVAERIPDVAAFEPGERFIFCGGIACGVAAPAQAGEIVHPEGDVRLLGW